MNVLRLDDVRRSYKMGREVEVHALRGVTLDVSAGEFVAIVGPSGSGKTTLLNVAGLLDHPDGGQVWLDDRSAGGLKEAERARLRRERIGFVFQSFNLLPHLTALENAALPLRYAEGVDRSRPAELLERVGLGQRLGHRPDQLSGGEQQRVAIARALVCDPPLILADEPTGDLDSETAAGIVELLNSLRDQGKGLIVVTHNEELAKAAGRLIHMRDGRIVDDSADVQEVAAVERSRKAKPKAKARAKADPKAGPEAGSGRSGASKARAKTKPKPRPRRKGAE